LKTLQQAVNKSKSDCANHFWEVLQKAEELLRDVLLVRDKDGLICGKLSTPSHALSAGTVQHQLCEYRQFNKCKKKGKGDLNAKEPPKTRAKAKAKAEAKGSGKPAARCSAKPKAEDAAKAKASRNKSSKRKA
jgi:hypothetical protein